MRPKPIMLFLVVVVLLATSYAPHDVSAQGPGNLPEVARSMIPSSFTYNPDLTRILRQGSAQLAAALPEEDQSLPFKVEWWGFSYAGSVDEAYAALSIPRDALELQPMSVPLVAKLTSYINQWGEDALADAWGNSWQNRALERSLEWANSQQRLASVMLWQEGDILVVADDQTELVQVTVLLGGENVSEWSGAMVMAAEDGSMEAFLVPDPDSKAIVGRLMPGSYEIMVIYDHEGVQALTMDMIKLDVLPDEGAARTVTLEVWDIPMRMPWSLDDIVEAQADSAVPDASAISYLSMYLASPYVNPGELTLMEGTHLLVSCFVEGEWKFED